MKVERQVYFSLFVWCLLALSCAHKKGTKTIDFTEKTDVDTFHIPNSTYKKTASKTSSPFDTTQTICDYNSDGYNDTLAYYYIGGSGSGGRDCILIDGKTQNKYQLSAGGCFCQIKRTVLIPPSLRKNENKNFRKAIAEKILPEKRNEADPSLQWIIQGTLHHSDLSNNKFFNRIIYAPLNWKQGKISLPDAYYIKIEGDTLAQLYREDEFAPDWYDKKDHNEGWLIYYGHNHYRNPSGDSLTLAHRSKTYQVFRTSHGLILKKEDLHAWVFVSDFELTGAPQKLRWESIGSVKIIDDHIIIKQNLPFFEKSQIFIINIETGMCGRLKFRPDETSEFKLSIDRLSFRENGSPLSFSLSEIFSALK